MMKRNFIYYAFFMLLFIACDSGETTSTDNSNTDSAEPTTQSDDNSSNPAAAEDQATIAPENKTVLSWVENLNIREQPNMKSNVVAKAKENESLTLTGEKSDFTEKVTLRGTSYDEPWVQVKTADGKIGWVFGGAIKKPGEQQRSTKKETKPSKSPTALWASFIGVKLTNCWMSIIRYSKNEQLISHRWTIMF